MQMWLDRFVDFMTTKRDMGDALRTVIASGGNPCAHSRDRLVAAVTTRRPGPARPGQPGLGLIMDGLRYRAPG
jgi:hypothetical protein